MKKKLGLLGVTLLLFVALGMDITNKSRMTQFVAESSDNFYISLKLDDRMQNIMPWYDEEDEIYYFFLPSCVKEDVIYFDSKSDCRIKFDGREVSVRSSFSWKKGEVYTVNLDDQSFRVSFMKSENLPSLFMNTESGSMEAVWADKKYEEPGTLTVVGPEGNIQYSGKLDKISGRGNSTWKNTKKKPYSISLTDSHPLCDLNANKNWNLLSLWYEHDKIHTKIIFDLAREVGLSGTPECTWVDLYCEGEYQGLYLLTEKVSADYKNDQGVLIEREYIDRIEEDESFFGTSNCHYTFTYENPSSISEEQMREAADFVQNVENLIVAEDTTYKEYIDIDSIAKQYLLDKIFMEKDSMLMSTFYYVDLNADKLYAGPLWDYDRALGLILPDYRSSIDAEPNYMYTWYHAFYDDSEFYRTMYETYIELLPDFERILQQDIDRYAEWIRASVEMDTVLYEEYIYVADGDNTNRYISWDNYLKYMKYFLANRLNYLSDLWDAETSEFTGPESTEVYHNVYFRTMDGAVIQKRSVLDGTCMTELPALDEGMYLGWYFWHLHDEYSTLRPVYEDLVLYAKPIKK